MNKITLTRKKNLFKRYFDESRTLEVVVNKENDECMFVKNPQIDFIELWFHSPMESNLHHTLDNFSPVHVESAPVIESPNISILEFFHKSDNPLEIFLGGRYHPIFHNKVGKFELLRSIPTSKFSFPFLFSQLFSIFPFFFFHFPSSILSLVSLFLSSLLLSLSSYHT
jgi:hypothetical protein